MPQIASAHADPENIRSEKINMGGLNVHYLTGGRGEPLIIVHGGGGCSTHWKQNAAVLAESYTIYVPDLPGFGGTQPLQGQCFIPEFVDFVEKFACSLGLERFHLMGHSLGGGIALSYALKFPWKITKLVLVNSLCLGREIALWVRFLSRPEISRCTSRIVRGLFRAAAWVVEAVLRAPFELAMPFSTASVDLGGYLTTFKEQSNVLLNSLSELVMPTLVIWGADDPIVPYRQAYEAAKLIPDCRVKVFADCGHSVYRESMAEFSSLLKDFLD